MLNKIKLFYKIRKFYNIFGDEVGNSFITKLSEMTTDNLNDVLFDLNEALNGYDYDDNEMVFWLKDLRRDIRDYCETKPSMLITVCATIGILFALWLTISTVEVASKNIDSNPEYSPINAWVLLTGGDN